MVATMPCQAPFQHQMCFIRSLTKLGVGRHDNFFPPSTFHNMPHRRVFFANNSCFLPRSLSIPNHMKALGPTCPGVGCGGGGGLLLTNTMEPVGLILVFRGPKGGLPNVPALSIPIPKKAGS